jgi:hypothetical protein
VTKCLRPLHRDWFMRMTSKAILYGGTSLVVSALKEKKRTIFALVAASVISLVVWGLVVVLNVR